MAEKKFRGQEVNVSIDNINVGWLQDCEVTIEFEYEELQGQSPEIIARQVNREAISVSMEWGGWDFSDLRSEFFDSEGKFKHDSAPTEFDLDGTFTDTDGVDHEMTIENVAFEELSLPFARDDFVTLSMSGTGTDIQIKE